MATPAANSIEKVYVVRTDGTPAVIKDLTTINKLFQSIAKSKAVLSGQKSGLEDVAEIAKVNEKLAELNVQEAKAVEAKKSILDAARQEIAVNGQLIGSYEQLKAQIAGINSGNATPEETVNQQATAINNLAAARTKLTDATAASIPVEQAETAAENENLTIAMTAAEFEEKMAANRAEQIADRAARTAEILKESEAVVENADATATAAAAAEKLDISSLDVSQRFAVLSAQAKEVAASMRELITAYNDGVISEDKFLQAGSRLAVQQAGIKAELAATNAELKAQIDLDIANANSINAWRAQVKLLTIERNNENELTQIGAVRQRELNAEIDHYNVLIKASADDYLKQKINIGNYPTLTAELRDLRLEMERLALAGQEDSAEFEQLSARAQILAAAQTKARDATKATVVAEEEEAVVTKTTGQAIQEKVGRALALENVAGRLITSFTRMGIHFLAFIVIAKGIEYIIEKLSDMNAVLNAGEQVLADYDKALADTVQQTGLEVAKLTALQNVLSGNVETRQNQVKALEEAKAQYPEYLANLQAEDVGTQKVNDAIQNQINLLRQRASITAAETAVGDAVKAQATAFSNLFKDANGLEVLAAGGSSNIILQRALELDKANQQLRDSYSQLQDAQNGNIEANQRQLDIIDKTIPKYQEMIRAERESAGQGEFYLSKSILEYEKLISALQTYRDLLSKPQAAPPLPVEDQAKTQLDLDNAAALDAKKHSITELRALNKVAEDEAGRALVALHDEYTKKKGYREEDLKNSAGYAAGIELIEATMRRKLADNQDAYDKARGKSTANQEYKGLKELFDAVAELRDQQLQRDVEANQQTFQDDKQTLEKRLEAHTNYQADLVEQAKVARTKVQSEALAEEKSVDTQLNDGRKKSVAQTNSLLDQKAAAYAKFVGAEETFQATLANIIRTGANEVEGIEKSDVQKRLEGLSALRAAEQKDRDEDLEKNRQNYKDKLINYDTYKQREKLITADSAAFEQEEVVRFLQEQLDSIKTNNAGAIALRKALNDALNALYKADTVAFDDAEEKKAQQHKRFIASVKEASANAAQTIADGYITQQQRQIDADNEAAQSALDNQKTLALGAAQSAAEKAAIEKEYDQKNEALKKAQFERSKQLAEATLALDFAVATGKAAASATGVGPAWLIDFLEKEAAVAIQYAAKLAVVESQHYERGGIVSNGGTFGGNAHTHGGTPFMFAGRAHEAEAGELAVINKRSAASTQRLSVAGTPMQIASAINAFGGGVHFAPGAALRRFEYGGSLGATLPAPYLPPVSSGSGFDGSAINEFIRFSTALMQTVNSRIDNLTVSLNPNAVQRSLDEQAKFVQLGRL